MGNRDYCKNGFCHYTYEAHCLLSIMQFMGNKVLLVTGDEADAILLARSSDRRGKRKGREVAPLLLGLLHMERAQ